MNPHLRLKRDRDCALWTIFLHFVGKRFLFSLCVEIQTKMALGRREEEGDLIRPRYVFSKVFPRPRDDRHDHHHDRDDDHDDDHQT